LTTLALAVAAALWPPLDGQAQQAEPRATFRSGVDLVSVAAVVRDRQGRVVRSLGAPDFLVIENGRPRPIVGLDADDGSPSAIALLVDASGSMRLGTSRAATRQLAHAILAELRQDRDRAALMAFDSRLMTLRPFTGEFDEIRDGLREIESFGATSLYGAIAGAAGEVAKRTRQRRTHMVFDKRSRTP
jgi:VWFA-related protein